MKWDLVDKFVEIKSPWLTVIGEKFKDNQGKILDYWRVEKADSVIIITSYRQQLIFPKPMFRPGVNKITLDFAGGRVRQGKNPQESALLILKQELDLEVNDLQILAPINQQGWEVNSSFSNQKLWGFFVEIKPTVIIKENHIGAIYPQNNMAIKKLLQDLTCIQCRALLQEWLIKSSKADGF